MRVCMYVCMYVFVSVCVCVCERERERERRLTICLYCKIDLSVWVPVEFLLTVKQFILSCCCLCLSYFTFLH